MFNDKVLYVSKDYMKDKECASYIYVRDDFDDEILGKIWRGYDFEKAQLRIFNLQCKLSKVALIDNKKKIKQIQKKIVYSTEAKMLAIREVSEIAKASAGIDGIVWRKDSDKMRACINLNNGEYKAKPMKQFVFKDVKAQKERKVGIPTVRR